MVDDHELMREGLKQLFECVDDIQVCAEAVCGEEVLVILQKETFDLVLLDITIPGIHGVELISKIRERLDSPPILILSMHNEPQIAKHKLKAGASGYITKDSSPKELLAAIRKVASGGRYMAPEIAEKIAFEASTAEPLVLHELLSGRELLILRMLVNGKKINEIAKNLGISSKTVSTHKARLMQKMHIDNTAKLMQYAIANGLMV
jgi:DNA-binding NarL/FixJ family response regulator